jgi:leader peptidase (prepilin peptidase) / N-methyltransferase
MDALLTGVAVVAGLLTGDLLEVVVERVVGREDWERPWWRCEACRAPATGLALVPLVRVVARARPCPSCATRAAHARRPAVLSLLAGGVLGVFAARIGADVALVAYCVFGLSLIAISAVDLETMRIPNRLVYPTFVVMVPLLALASAVDDRWGSLARAAVAGASAFVVFFAIHLLVPRGMGFGDVRLAALIGLGVGWLGLGHAFVAFFVAFVLGAVIGLTLVIVTGRGRGTRIAFGPFLSAGAVIAVAWGGPLADVLLHGRS